MAAMSVTLSLLIFTCHVALIVGYYTGPMAEQDQTALEAVKAAVAKKENFPAIQCYGGGGDWYNATFRCDDSGRVYSVYLYNLGLGGSIAPEIGNVTMLKYLDLRVNQLGGSIPSSISELPSLQRLYLQNNQLSGSIPSSIGQLKSLQRLFLFNNQLSGSIPLSIGQLTSLEDFYLSNNQLSGSIPSSIDQLTSLGEFKIDNNYFTGPVIRGNGHPYCSELNTNCLFGSSLPTECAPSGQRSKSDCDTFCNATQLGGPCGGGGICSNGTNGTSSCACNEGYTNQDSKFICKWVYDTPLPPSSPPSVAGVQPTLTPPPGVQRTPTTPPIPGVQPTPKNPPGNTIAIIGGVLGGVVALLLVGGGLFVFLKKRSYGDKNQGLAKRYIRPDEVSES